MNPEPKQRPKDGLCPCCGSYRVSSDTFNGHQFWLCDDCNWGSDERPR